MTVRDIYKLICYDSIYTLELMDYINDGEYVPLYRMKEFTAKDWNKQVESISIVDETIDINNPSIVISCYIKKEI